MRERFHQLVWRKRYAAITFPFDACFALPFDSCFALPDAFGCAHCFAGFA